MTGPGAGERPVRILVADDHELFRKGVRALISTHPGIEVVGEAANGVDAVRESRRLMPDLVLMDLRMPGGSGLAAIREITAESPGVNVMVVSMFEDDESVFAAMRAGARGYVLKDMDADGFARAILMAGRGEALFSRSIAARMVTFFSAPPGTDRPFPDLTPSERSVLTLLARGVNNAGIARELSLAPKTVRNYISNIFRKLAVADRAQAIVLARDAGLDAGAP
jgi:DNA-binding NarL/FixJ family response regulator